MIHFEKIYDYHKIIEGNFYLIHNYEIYANGEKYIHMLKGKIKRKYNEVIIEEDNYEHFVEFHKLYNLLGIERFGYKKINLFDCEVYTLISKKPQIQKNMEERSLRDILRKIIGDPTFSHYLFDCQIKMKYEEL